MSQYDDSDGLSGYLGLFSDADSLPTSLQGYGHSSARHMAALNGLGAAAQKQSDDPSGPKPLASTLKIGTPRWQALRSMLVKDVQWGLNQLGYKAGTSGVFDKTVQSAYAQYVKLFKQNNGKPYEIDFVPASGGFDSTHWVWANTVALADLGARAKTASSKGGAVPKASPAANTAKQAPAPAPQKAAGNSFVTSVASVQDILVRLGWKSKGKTTGALSKDMTDGLFGSTTVTNWQQSASKRKLDPAIARASGTTVTVNQATFLGLKAVADQMVPPTANQPVVPAPSGTTTITEAKLNEVLARLAGAKTAQVLPFDQLVAYYQSTAKSNGLDTSISKDQKGGVVVSTATWDAFVARANTLPAPAPAAKPAPTPAQKSDIDKAKDAIAKAATTSLPVTTLTKFFNAAIAAGSLKHDVIKSNTWTDEHAKLIVAMRNVEGAVKTAWEQMLVKGKLVAADLKNVKLPKADVDSIKKVVADYDAQAKAEKAAKKGFTKVTTSKIIGYVNALNISTTTFKTNGDVKELTDALRTFVDNTKQKVSGDLVWVQDKTKDVYVNDDVLKALAKATDDEAKRTTATQAYRDKMVADALSVSTASVTIDNLQLAIIETVESKKAGKSEKLYAKVKNTGAFDGPTKDAYAELAKVLTIGPSVLQFQDLLKAQMGANFKVDLVKQTESKVWAEFLAKAVSKTDVKTLPALAQKINEAAETRKKRLGSKAVDAEKKVAAQKLVADVLAKSTFLVTVFDAQMALLEGQDRKELKAPGIKVTGVTDDALRKAMEGYIFGMIFPKNSNIAAAEWNTYLDSIGIRVASGKATFGWKSANWLALTQAAANYISERSAQYMAKHGVPKGYDGLAKIPVSDARFSKATVVKVTVPAKEKVVVFDEKEEAAAKKKADAAAAAKKKADAAKKKSDAQKKLEAEAKKLKDQIAKDKAATAKLKAEEKKKAAAAKAAKAAADAAAAKAAADASNQALQDAAARAQADAKAAQDAANAALAAQQQREADLAAREAALAAQQAAQAGAGGAGGDVNLTINTPPAPTPDTGVPSFIPAPPAPLPEILPETTPVTPAPEPAPVQEAGMFSPSSFLLLSAVGLGVLFFGKDKAKTGAQDNQQRTRYSKRGGRK